MSDELHNTEPADYAIVKSSKFNRCKLGDTDYTVGFCVNSPGAAGYCDDSVLWIADQITNPERFIEVAIHEGLHGIYPEWPEDFVDSTASQLAALVVGVFQAKGATLPEVKPLVTDDNAPTLFPGSKRARGEGR